MRRNRKKNLPSVGGHNHHVHGNQYEAYNPHGFGAKPLGSHLRGGESRGRATGGVAANTFDAYKPKTPNLDKRPPMTPNFEPFGRCVFLSLQSTGALQLSHARVAGARSARRITNTRHGHRALRTSTCSRSNIAGAFSQTAAVLFAVWIRA